MIESKLTELLEHTGEQVHVGPPPIEALRAGAVRRRRRRTAAVSVASVVAVVAAVGGTTLLTQGSKGVDPNPPVASGTPVTVPEGMRLVGIGHAAIAVPNAWGTNQSFCGTPRKDTVEIDIGAVAACGIPRAAGVDSVQVANRQPFENFRADQTLDIDGVPAQRQRTSCAKGAMGKVTTCTSTVVIPSLGVWFRAESSTSAVEVDRILSRITIVPGLVGVPGYSTNNLNGELPTAAEYVDSLRQLGLKAEIQNPMTSGDIPSGTVRSASPGPGTMLAPGATVTISVHR
jgi:hypothetical protein